MTDAIDDYNRVLNLCRNTPQRKYNIVMELDIPNNRIGSMLTTLIKRGLLKASHSNGNKKLYNYLTVEGAVYTVLPVFGAGRPNKNANVNNGIQVKGNVTTVTSGSYHTKGSAHKRSVWIGSSADM